MKVTAVESFVLTVPVAKPIALEFPHHKLVVARVTTDEGIPGLGYSLAFGGGGAEAIKVYLDTRLAPLVIGEDPLFVERLWERMFRADRGIKRQGIAAYALAALDIGLWDVAGRAARLPLYKLWGAVTDRVPAYGSGGWGRYSLDDLVGEAERYAAMGCRYYKMKIHAPDPRENRTRVETVRKALGDGVRMMVDVNQRLDVLGNLRQAALLEDFDLVWYEEPVLADDIASCAEVARSIRIWRRARTTIRASSSATSWSVGPPAT
jgi:L-alanine-DL-glutamate epimerase-like enolase superfamily enzyme